MSLERVAIAVLAVLFAGCSQQYPHASAPAARANVHAAAPATAAQVLENARHLQLLMNQARDASRELEAIRSLRFVGMDDGPVPDFELSAPGGVRYSSKALVGRQAFVAVFFATWCEYCKAELQTLERDFEQVGPLPLIPVAVDGPETWSEVPSYLATLGIGERAVLAREYPLFAASYNPFDTVPLLVIVGRNGGLVDFLQGYDPDNSERLLSSLRLAKTIGPLAKPEIDAANTP